MEGGREGIRELKTKRGVCGCLVSGRVESTLNGNLSRIKQRII